jgi:hypothetical protein
MSTPSFTAFKRKLSVGTLVHVENLAHPNLTSDRKLTKVQGNAIAGYVTRADGEIVESWIYWPRANETKMNSDTSVSLIKPGSDEPWLTVTVLP